MPPPVKDFGTRLVQLSRRGRRKVLSEVMWPHASYDLRSDRLTGFTLYFDKPDRPGAFIAELDRDAAEYLYRQLAQALERDDIAQERQQARASQGLQTPRDGEPPRN